MSKYRPENNMPKEYAVVRRWKDDPSDFEVVEYFETLIECRQFIAKQKKSHRFQWEVAKYE